MSDLQQFQCPNCGGTIEYNPITGKPTCPYCGTEFELETLQSYEDVVNETVEQNVDFNSSQAGEAWGDDDKLTAYVCKSCGGSIITDENTVAQSCPYCGNPVVVTSNVKGDLKPDLVIPFKLDKQAAMDNFKKHLSDKPMLPKMFTRSNLLEEIKGVYVPFWTYDVDLNVAARYRATQTRSWSDGSYNYVEKKYYEVFRHAAMGFDDVPVDGSSKVDSVLMESIEPFDMSQAVDFQTAYLAGYFADKYDIDSQQSSSEAYARIKKSSLLSLDATVVGFDSMTLTGYNMNLDDSKVKYVLLPVWLMTTKYNGETYTFAMNGQTGKFVGDLPVDKGIFWKKFIQYFVISSLVILILQVVFRIFM